MKRAIGTPGFLKDYNSLWSPLLAAYLSFAPDFHHVLPVGRPLGLRYNAAQMIDREILTKYGARETQFKKDEFIFQEGEQALYYYQVIMGSVKMMTTSSDGQEFIQGIFKVNDSFGEPALLCDFPYPSSARALQACQLAKVSKENFLLLLKENFDVHLQLDQMLCQRLKYKSMILSEISFYDPEHRILSLLNYFKQDSTRVQRVADNRQNYLVPLTRQQLADLTGLRVETVIRTVKKMEGDGKLKLIGRKIAL
jgi:CRP/FNR family transcriptional regulator, cyclic AMP receptor protein